MAEQSTADEEPHRRSALARLRPASFGAEPTGERLARIRRSPQFRDGAFRNERPTRTLSFREALPLLRQSFDRTRWARRAPTEAPPVVRPAVLDRGGPPASGLRLTWLGHATVLVEIDGHRVLFDPVWGERCSPFGFAGPRRLHPAPMSLAELGRLDAVVVSHDHYDHLDMPTIRALAGTDTVFAVPLGVGAHLEHWSVPAGRIVELDWWESTRVGELTLTATPGQHFCGRGLRNQGVTLWASWAVAGPEHRVFHSGDTGYFPGFADIGARLGPFDATMMQMGAYSPEFWPDVHMTPDEGVRAHLDLSGGSPHGVLLPIHWATFNLAPHPWDEPAEWSLRAASAAGVAVTMPRPGESFEPTAGDLPGAPWWRALARPAPEAAPPAPVEPALEPAPEPARRPAER
ncbi:MBL fold metallo-hydrolase [Streptomyces sp. 8K308]|uniref:MBL fold metallo-hydrolase n=1 Tax=Streptomyces sp. 8K308 TaxID=2530388 RepID=UPI0010429096|nr:MBL fold metallo-hydrolase [Streptomyces sp. 8K308]TDC23848.1 MBL fold metallo-hydrolase [Streptomyces sp. 8K308]